MRLPDGRGGAGLVTVPKGHPGELRAAAGRLARAAAVGESTALVRGTAVKDVEIAWDGPAAAAAKAELATLAARCGTVLPRLGAGARALHAYADALERAQGAARRLGTRADAVQDEHAQAVAAAQANVTDPALRAAAIARADTRRVAGLTAVGRERARVQGELMAAAARCAAALEQHTPAGGDVAGVRLVEGLPFTESLLQNAFRPPQQPAFGVPESEAPEPDWWATVRDGASDTAARAWNHVVVPVVNTAADVVEAAAEHPEDIVGIGVGVGQIILGAGGQVGGIALDATGVGVVAGVPVQVASAGLIASGAVVATASAVQLGQHAAAKDSMLLKEVQLKQGTHGMGGTPIPDSLRPPAAGRTWKGHIAHDGNGVVWQRPQDRCPPPKVCTPNSMRINDPGQRYTGGGSAGERVTIDYPYGYVRFFNRGGQALKLDGKPGSHAETHHHIRPDGTYDTPTGWDPL
ncbi:hypothetical protein OO014_07465 [Intrasporangium calvum]|uniref:HNH endonuclease n=1 Tax=Intrasporangium calvum TaxID=53358 RepID=A0ABT5GFR8_9MICO|nr:hypothetical protein [Intrasporangium calvum]MDC5697094.1 hypothetical protein [Intrasporangium calvum]